MSQREKWGGLIFPTVVNILPLPLIIFLIPGEAQDSLRRHKNRAENLRISKSLWITATVFPDYNFDRLDLTQMIMGFGVDIFFSSKF